MNPPACEYLGSKSLQPVRWASKSWSATSEGKNVQNLRRGHLKWHSFFQFVCSNPFRQVNRVRDQHRKEYECIKHKIFCSWPISHVVRTLSKDFFVRFGFCTWVAVVLPVLLRSLVVYWPISETFVSPTPPCEDWSWKWKISTVYQHKMSSSSSASTKSQYHHFIPRFILQNFAHPYKPSDKLPNKSAKNRKQKQKDGYRPGEKMLHAIDLAGAAPNLIETPVSHTFGLTDMYRDFTNATNQHYLEDQLSRLESRAGMVISKIRKALEVGQAEVWIPRPDRDILRKFLFIMKYRGSRAHQRFYHESADGYSENDREKLLRYMREKGFERPIDVWFDNIKALLELKMDPNREWIGKLMDRIYPDDAKWYIAHTQMMYLALCTPSGQEEFLLTENCYGIHEGPTTQTTYTEYHIFGVISPKLVMVLRSFILPVLEEDSDEEMRLWRQSMYQLNVNQHVDPQNAKSILKDLPVTKARNSYTKLVDGRIILIDGEDGSYRSNHKFCFRFFHISADHVNKINAIMLAESHNTSKIVFKSKFWVIKTLEHYLSMPCEQGGVYCWKIFEDIPDEPRLAWFKKLEQAAKQLGSNETAVYRILPSEINREQELEALSQKLSESFPKEIPPTMRPYMKLGQLMKVSKQISHWPLCRWKRYDVVEGHGSGSQNAKHENQNRRVDAGAWGEF